MFWLLHCVVLAKLSIATAVVSCPRERIAVGRVLEIESHPYQIIVPETFDGVRTAIPQLEALILRHDSIRTIKDNSFATLSSLKCLDLSYNELQNVSDRAFEGLTKLKTLILSSSRLLLRAKLFAPLVSVEILDISNCSLSSINKETLRGLENLRALHLESNNLTAISSDALFGLQKLEYLSVSNNPLHQVDIYLLPSLKQLSAAACKLTSVPAFDLTYNPNLSKLNLSRNYIQNVPNDLVRDFAKMNEIWIDNNPWECTCDTIRLYYAALANHTALTGRQIDDNYLRCSFSMPQFDDHIVANMSQFVDTHCDLGQPIQPIKLTTAVRITPAAVTNTAKKLQSGGTKPQPEPEPAPSPGDFRRKPTLDVTNGPNVLIIEKTKESSTFAASNFVIWILAGVATALIAIVCFIVIKKYKNRMRWFECTRRHSSRVEPAELALAETDSPAARSTPNPSPSPPTVNEERRLVREPRDQNGASTSVYNVPTVPGTQADNRGISAASSRFYADADTPKYSLPNKPMLPVDKFEQRRSASSTLLLY